MPTIGPFEIIVVLVIVLLIFGPKKLPDLGRSLGSGMREFKDSITGKSTDDEPSEIASGESDKLKKKPEQQDDAVSSPRG